VPDLLPVAGNKLPLSQTTDNEQLQLSGKQGRVMAWEQVEKQKKPSRAI
jgi:hypothetical protein